MKKLVVLLIPVFMGSALQAQTYPDPEFSNELYFLQKGDSASVVRLEKSASQMEYKSKAAGFGGAENGYEIEGERSPVRLSSVAELSFVFSTGAATANSAVTDSLMLANGMDPSMMSDMSGMGGISDPATAFTLYKADPVKGVRKIYLMKIKGAFSIGNKTQSSDKFTFGVRKIRPGYWELVLDKTLPEGEYAFSLMGASYDGSTTLFAFGVD